MRERRRDAYFMEAPVLERTGRPRQAFLPTIYRRPAVWDPLGERQVRLDSLHVGLVHEPDFASCLLRLAFLVAMRWRRVAWERSTFPVPVILNRLATAFLVLLRAMDFGIRRGRYARPPGLTTDFLFTARPIRRSFDDGNHKGQHTARRDYRRGLWWPGGRKTSRERAGLGNGDRSDELSPFSAAPLPGRDRCAFSSGYCRAGARDPWKI